MSKEDQVIDCKFQGLKSLKGQNIHDKYTVGSCIGIGCFGSVFKVQNSDNVIKISLDTEMMAHEIKTLITMQKSR